jgi:hypothetical protein
MTGGGAALTVRSLRHHREEGQEQFNAIIKR